MNDPIETLESDAGHSAPTWMVTWSPDSRRVASASEDGTVRIWRLGQPRCEHVLRGHEDGVWSATWSPDGARVLSGGNDGAACLWDAATGALQRKLEPGGGAIWATGWSPGGEMFATGARDGLLRLFDGKSGDEISRLRGHGDLVKDLVIAPDGRHLASSSDDRSILVFDLETEQVALRLHGHEHMANTVDFTPDGRRLVTCSHDRSVRMWDLATGRCLWSVRAHEDDIDAARISPDGRRIASSSHDKTVRLWNERGELEAVISGHTDEVEWVSWSPDGRWLSTASIDASVRLFDAQSLALVTTFAGRNRSVSRMRANRRGQVAAIQDDRSVTVFDPQTRQIALRVRDLQHEAVKGLAWSPDGGRLACASLDATVVLLDPSRAGGDPVQRGAGAGVYAVDWSPDGERLALGLADGAVEIRHVESWDLVERHHDHQEPVYAVAWRPDGEALASASRDGTVGLRRGGAFRRLTGHTDLVMALAWSPDGERIASGSRDATIRLWSADGEALGTLAGHRLTVWDLAFTPSGKRLLSSSFDHDVRVWRDGRCERVVTGHTRQVGTVTALDEVRALSGSRDGTCRLIDLDDGSATVLHPERLGEAAPRRRGYAASAPMPAPAVRRRAGPLEVALSSANKLLSLWAALGRARWWSEPRFAAYQERQLRRVVRDAWDHVPVYRELWEQAGVRPESIRGLADLAKLPIVGKDDVRDRYPDGAVRRGTDLSRCRIQQTSGSSGQCMEIALSLRCDDMRNIWSQRIYGWNGFRWHNKTAYLFPYRLPFENNLGIYRNVWIDAKEHPDTVLDRIAAERPVVLAATPSDVFDLLEGMAPGRDVTGLGISALSLHSEPLSPDERSHLEQVFGCPVRVNYYCNEIWAIAAECEHGSLHQFMDNAILELVDDAGLPVRDGTPGHVIVTGLHNRIQPFIRYRLGDIAVRRAARDCACGRGLPILEGLEGRDDDVFVHPDGRRIHPSKVTVAVKSPCFEHPGRQVFRDYQIVQDAPDHVTVRLVAGRDREPFDDCAARGVRNLEQLLAPGVRVSLEVLPRVPIGSGGKRKIFCREHPARRSER